MIKVFERNEIKTEKTNTFFYIWIIYFKQNIVHWCGHSIIGGALSDLFFLANVP